MKNAWTVLETWKAASLAIALLIGAGACDRGTGMEAGFKYTAGWLSAELTEVTPEEASLSGSVGSEATEGTGTDQGQGTRRLEIPKTLGGKRVRSVAPGAFRLCTNEVSVKVPSRVSRIGAGAFAECTELVWVELPSHLKCIEEGLFRKCRRLAETVIPDRVKEIGPRAYQGCSQLGRVVMPKGLRSVGEDAFSGCTLLASLDLPPGVTALGPRAFRGCHSLETIVLPPRLRKIEEGLFDDCPRLGKVVVPESVTELGKHAFKDCTSLTSLDLPPGTALIGDGIFAGCRSLEHMELPPGLANIPDGAFEGCSGLRTVRIPAGVTNIGARAFAGCVSLERIELPEGVRSIGDDAFADCGRLESAAIPGSVERLGERAFADCAGLKSVELPESLSAMGRECFRGTGLGSMAVPAGLAVLEEGVFSGCTALETVRLFPGLESVQADAFRTCPVANLSLPATVRSIHPSALSACPVLGSVEVADGNPVFSSRDGVLFRDGGAELVFFPRTRGGRYAVPEDVARIGPGAFRGSEVEDVSVPDGVGTIAESAFRDCRRLRRAAIGAGVEEIGEGAFAGCSDLWEFVMPAGVGRTGGDLFAGCDALRFLVVPDRLPDGLPPEGTWPVPEGCSVLPRSEWEEMRSGRHSPQEDSATPFYGLYTGTDLDTADFEGTVLDVSAIPDPDRNDYDDCLYAILVELVSVQSTTPSSTNLERVVIVNVPVMEKRTILREHVFEPGDKVRCTCAAYEDMPLGILEIQLSDDIQSFEHRQYYPVKIERIPAFRKTGNRNFAKQEITILPVRSLPRDAGAAAARQERIRNEITRIENELERHGGSFEAWKEEYKPVAEKYARLCGENHEGWIGDSYFSAKGPETTYDTKAFIEGLLPYKKYLDENNIDLIVARVPSRWDFAARVLAADDFRENPAWVENLYECLKNDIEIIDPMPEMWERRFDFPLFYFYHDPIEFHPCEGTAFVVGKAIADVLKRYPYPVADPEIVLLDLVCKINRPWLFWPKGNEKFDPSENLVVKHAVQDGMPLGVTLDSGSPFLFFSGSMFYYPHGAMGASVPAYAGFFLQTRPDWFYQRGDVNPLLKHLANSKYLHFRRAVIFVGGPETWGRVPPLPRYIQDRARRISLERTIPAASEEIQFDVKGAYSHSETETGSVAFVPDVPLHGEEAAPPFDMAFKVPYMEGRRACMVRVNLERVSNLLVHLVDRESDEPADTSSLLPSNHHTADFFIPLSKPDTDVKIRFQPKNEFGLSVKNIELWYY